MLKLVSGPRHDPKLPGLQLLSLTPNLRLPGSREEREIAMTLDPAEAGFPSQAAAAFHLGWVRAQQEEVEEGVAHMRQRLAEWRSKGTETVAPSFPPTLAEAYMGWLGERGRLRFLEEVLDHMEKTGSCVLP